MSRRWRAETWSWKVFATGEQRQMTSCAAREAGASGRLGGVEDFGVRTDGPCDFGEPTRFGAPAQLRSEPGGCLALRLWLAAVCFAPAAVVLRVAALVL